jgi:hypothetical protein
MMSLLIIFTSEEEGAEEILRILSENNVVKGVVIESQGMREILGYNLSAAQLLAIFSQKRPFNRTIMAVIEKDNVREIINLINGYWKSDKDKQRKKNRVMFSVPIDNLTIGL